ncbi:MAG: metallophosphoesterase [Candidatus Riflebacteria bacterium]|nr:metallophosphoesterase [Candidatus Riflebacteria bacterium]
MIQNILLVSDVHDNKLEEAEINSVVKGSTVNAVLFLGDVQQSIMEFCKTRFYTAYFFGAVKGNHDDRVPFPPFVTPLNMAVENCGTLKIAGIDGCLAYKDVGHFLLSDLQIFEMLQTLPDVDLLITHGPPSFHAKDDGVHFGSEALAKFILDGHCRYLIHGHIHEERITPIGNFEDQRYAISVRKLKMIRV